MPGLEGLGGLSGEALPGYLSCSCLPSTTTTKVMWISLFRIYPGTCTYPTLGRSLVGWEEPSLAVGSQNAPVPTSSTAGNKMMAASFTRVYTLAAAACV